MQNSVNDPNMYQCPVCNAPLQANQMQVRCDQGHSFDVHKKGYLNLLLAHQKNSKAPGDDAQMVASRRRFLDEGHYHRLADTIALQIQKVLPTNANLWDAGCGEGYYTQVIRDRNPGLSIYGLDISKPAIQASSRFKSIHWCVASSTHPPYLDESFDGIVSVFSRVDAEPFARVLKPGGFVFMAVPDSDHLLNLREHIYETVRPYDTSKHLSYFEQGFELENEERITVDLQLESSEAILDLLGMTPHAHRLPTEKRQTLARLDSLSDTACFKLYQFKKSHPHPSQIS
jgi:23S rRNA (guanine745-N1)-methyltransferase